MSVVPVCYEETRCECKVGDGCAAFCNAEHASQDEPFCAAQKPLRFTAAPRRHSPTLQSKGSVKSLNYAIATIIIICIIIIIIIIISVSVISNVSIIIIIDPVVSLIPHAHHVS